MRLCDRIILVLSDSANVLLRLCSHSIVGSQVAPHVRDQHVRAHLWTAPDFAIAELHRVHPQ